jgi:hypothetical protein
LGGKEDATSRRRSRRHREFVAIPGHPYAGGNFGTKKDVQHIAYMEDLSAEVKRAADVGNASIRR